MNLRVLVALLCLARATPRSLGRSYGYDPSARSTDMTESEDYLAPLHALRQKASGTSGGIDGVVGTKKKTPMERLEAAEVHLKGEKDTGSVGGRLEWLEWALEIEPTTGSLPTRLRAIEEKLTEDWRFTPE